MLHNYLTMAKAKKTAPQKAAPKKAAVKSGTSVRHKSTGLVFKEKSARHKKAIKSINKLLNDDFWINSALGNAVENLEGVDPFTFVITIDINPNIQIVEIAVNGTTAKKDNFKVADGKITCTLKAIVSTFNFLLNIKAEGEPENETTFNLTCDGEKVFSSDQKIRITATGKGAFFDQAVPLP